MKSSFLRLFFLIIAGGIIYYNVHTPPATTLKLDDLDSMDDIGGPFTLTDQFGKTRKNTDFLKKYMIVYFGYSYCPDMCPLALQNITKALESLKRDRDQFQVLFITLDPARDTVEQLRVYSENYDPNFLFLTGSKDAIDRVSQAYKAYAKEMPATETTEYLLDHSTLIYIMNRQGKIVGYFPHTVEGEKLGIMLNQLLSHQA